MKCHVVKFVEFYRMSKKMNTKLIKGNLKLVTSIYNMIICNYC